MNQPNDCRLVRVLTALICEPWLLTPEMHRTLTQIACAHAFGGAAEAAQHATAQAMPMKPKQRAFVLAGRTALIPVEGVIGRKFDTCLYSSGVTSVDVLQRIVAAASEDPEVDGLLLAFDSPGGLATGVPECAAAIRAVRASKTVIAYADGLCCSAAYWLASQAHAVYATPSARVGSIGAYMAMLDSSRANEMAGLKVEMLASGPFKGAGYPGTALTDPQRAMLQANVDTVAAQFKAAVRDGRQQPIDDSVMQGQDFNVTDAMAAGLIDSVCDFDTAVADAGANVNKPMAEGR
jgi:signal peptide peptidase SppA